MEARQYQRRLVTIVSADVVGYSRLMGADEEGTLARLTEYRAVIDDYVSKYRGRVFGGVGDSVMAEFSSPVEAVHCAVAVQRDIESRNNDLAQNRQMKFRMGINIGDVIAENDNLFGDAVNIAARLQEASLSGSILVSETVHTHVGGTLDVAFRDLGNLQCKNISNPIHAYETILSPQEADSVATTNNLVDVSIPVPGFKGRPALAVLPFDSLSRERDDEYIADGLTEDIISGLSHLRWFPVIARNSTFVFRGKPMNVIRIGSALGARYLLEGSLRVEGERLRVRAVLVDAVSGMNVWSDRYDRNLRNIFDVQADIAQNIVATLEAQISMAEQQRVYTKPPEQLNTWDIIRRSIWHQCRLTRDDAAIARRLFDAALRKDPYSVEAHIQLAWWYFWDVWTQRRSDAGLIEMERLARRAMTLDSMDARGHMLVGIAQAMLHQPDRGRRQLRDAIRLNPSQAIAHSVIGSSHILAGEPEKAIDPLVTAMRLSPHDLYIFHAFGELAVAYYMLGLWEEALSNCEKSLRLRPGYWYARVISANITNVFFRFDAIPRQFDAERVCNPTKPSPKSRIGSGSHSGASP